MTKHNTRGPSDANNSGKVIEPTNQSRSRSRGGAIIGEALRGTGDMDISGGC